MQNIMTPLVTMYQTQLEASRRVADAVFSGTEKIDRMMISATHRAFNEQINLAEAMTTARDPQTAGTTLQASLFSRNRSTAADYQKEIMRIFAEMQNEIGRSWQEYIQEMRSQAASSSTKPLEAAQARANDAVFDPMTSMFSVWESAFKEVADLARKNMATARSVAGDATGKTLQDVGNYADVAAARVEEAARDAAEVAVSAGSVTNATTNAPINTALKTPGDDSPSEKAGASSGATSGSSGKKK